MMTNFFSSKKKKQKTSTEAAAPLDGTTTETDADSKNNDANDDAFQNQHQGALKLPATKPNKMILNTYLQDYAATQLPRIDTNGRLFTTVGKGTASVANRKMIGDVDALGGLNRRTRLFRFILCRMHL